MCSNQYIHFELSSLPQPRLRPHKLFDITMDPELSECPIPDRVGPYIVRGTVGESSFAVVKLVCHEETHQFFACKVIPKSRLNTQNLRERLDVEIRINQQLNHAGIVQLYDLHKDDNNYYLIMEFCPNGELFQHIVHHQHLSEDDAKPFVRQILETLGYIHGQGITHRDLKPENLLLDKDGRVKLSDFGLSRFIPANGLVQTPCGSPCYASPECISGKPYDGKTTDVWSVGVVVYAMLTGQLPWTKRNQSQLFAQIRKGEYKVPSYLSEQCQNFIRGLMCVDTTKRLTIQDALDHPWMEGVPVQFGDGPVGVVSLKAVDRFLERDVSEPDLRDVPARREVSMVELTLGMTVKLVQGEKKEELPPPAELPSLGAPVAQKPKQQAPVKGSRTGLFGKGSQLRVPARNVVATCQGRRPSLTASKGAPTMLRKVVAKPTVGSRRGVR